LHGFADADQDEMTDPPLLRLSSVSLAREKKK
jgi:hypothetical protein